MDNWLIEYEIIDRDENSKGIIKLQTSFKDNFWSRTISLRRKSIFFSINRTVPVAENPTYSHKKKLRLSTNHLGVLNLPDVEISSSPVQEINHIKTEAEKILGKSLEHFQLLRVVFKKEKKKFKRIKVLDSYELLEDGQKIPIYTFKEDFIKTKNVVSERLMFLGGDGQNEYSEFNFGAGEASVIHLVADAESLPDNSLILIEEIENGLHPVAVRRLVEYFIDVANRKKLQVIFTTHSDYALTPLPSEAIWASIDGKVQQGKLSIEMLRAVSGRIDKRLAVFVEDEFAKFWVEAILREKLGEHLDEIGVYPVSGDGNAVKQVRQSNGV